VLFNLIVLFILAASPNPLQGRGLFDLPYIEVLSSKGVLVRKEEGFNEGRH
jgi:hypothetical protein